jgi:uncharacterized protein
MALGTALITGASSGIGAELAELCAAAGYDLVLVARTAPSLAKLADRLVAAHRIAANSIIADLADTAAPEQILAQLRGVTPDILINNAGFGLRGAYAETDWAVESRMIQVNIAALAHLTKLFLPAMLRRRSGRILNVASTAAFVPGPFMAVYYASKAFVLSFSEAVANEVQGTGVTVTALCPGPTETGFADVAGIKASKLFDAAVMSAGEVARQGYDAMIAGKPEVIAGARNRWMMRAVRLAPRGMVAASVARLNRD